MIKTKVIASTSSISFILISMCASVALSAPPMEPGEYEYKMTIKTEGLPPMAQPQLPKGGNAKVCLTAEDMKKSIPFQQAVNQQSCDLKVLKQTDLRVEWQMTCAGGMTTGSGWANYQKNAFVGETIASTTVQGMPTIKIISNFNGKRLGPCQARASN
jgi:hypothetical protein